MSEEKPASEAPDRPAVLAYNSPNSVGTLKATYRAKLAIPEITSFVAELNGESDRAAVILASSQLDDLLANAIALRMPFDLLVEDVDRVFRQGGPLGSFSFRTEIASLFGIIEKETFEQLTILREMRNACAHSKHPISFKDPLLRNVAFHLFEPRGSTPRVLAESNMKAAFVLEVASLVLVLALGSREAATAERSRAFKEMVGKLRPSPERPFES